MRTISLFLFACFLYAPSLLAQTDPRSTMEILRSNVDILASQTMQGRGYVNDGRERAASFIQRRFTELNIQPVPGSGGYLQGYAFPVNTFPGKMKLSINGRELKPGDDYLVDAASASFSGRGLAINKTDLSAIKDSAAWERLAATMDDRHIWYLDHSEAMCTALGIRLRDLAGILPKGCFIIPQTAKLTWTVSREQDIATVFYVKSESLPQTMKTGDAEVLAKLEPKAKSVNIVAEIPGKIKDSFIVLSAHYDHLGKMGEKALFPGASDNASGTAMLLYLASYYSAHPQRYSIVFIAFSGEEAGLMGSQCFVARPMVPLKNIKFLTNIDIMGDATDGVTVVNATEFPDQFALLNSINDEHRYIPIIKSRGKAANSDHYYFSEAGVPAFFMYSNGGKGHYHDIFDTAQEISLVNIEGVAKLLIDFVAALR